MSRRFLFAGFLAPLLLIGCTWNSAKRLAEKPVVEVKGQTLSLKEYSDRLARHLRQFDAILAKNPQQIERSRDLVLRDFIHRALLLAYAEEQKIEATDDEVTKAADEQRAQFPDDAAFRKSLAEANVSLNDWRKNIKEELIQKKVFETFRTKYPPPTDVDLKKVYDDNKDRFKTPERVYLRQIVTDEYAKALEIRESLKKKDFSELAKQYSVAPEGKEGGVIGWVEKGAVDLFDKTFTQAVGSTSAVLESPYGFHIFRVDKKAPAGVRRLEEVRALVEQLWWSQREQKEYTQWLDQQLRQIPVMIDYKLIQGLKVETRSQDW